jgi:phytoene dehydrogenase-like protein
MSHSVSINAFDAILIGAGHNALAAAVHLSVNGWRVLVLERAAAPGGAVKTAEVTLPGFRHDLYAMNLSLFAGSTFHGRYAQLLAEHGLRFVPVSRPFASVFAPDSQHTDWRWCGVEQGLQATLAHIERLSPADAPRWQSLSQRFEGLMPHLLGLLAQPVPDWGNLRWLWKLWRSQGSRQSLQLLQLLLSSSRHWLQREFESPELHAMLAAWGLHLDFAPDVAGGALFPFLEAMAGERFGMALGAGGADVVVQAMQRCIQAHGGQVRTGCEVSNIEVQQGRATGVCLSNGEVVHARRAVIAGVHPRQLYGSLLSPEVQLRIPQRYTASIRAAQALRSGPATMMIHLALKALPDWAAGTSLKQFAYVHLAPSLAQMALTYAQATNGILPAEPVLVVGQPTAFDSSRAPEGQHTLWIQVRALPFEVEADALGQISPASWDDIKGLYAHRVMRLLERYAPGLQSQVLAQHVISPLDMVRDNPNLVEGDSVSGSHHLDQFFLMRPAVGLTRWNTPIDGLFHIGASTWPGAGTGAGSGYMLASRLA